MTDSVNKVTLIGRAGQDAELTFTKNGSAISKFNLVTTRRWNNDKGEKQEDPCWHRITIFGKRAEGISKYIFKGSYLRIEGYIKNGKFKNKDGIDVYTSDIICEEIGFLSTKDENEKLANQPKGNGGKNNGNNSSGNSNKNLARKSEEPQNDPPDADFGNDPGFGSGNGSDDIPF